MIHKIVTSTMLILISGILFGQVYLDSGLVAYYLFNGNADDESGNGNDGTVNGATLTMDRFGNDSSSFSFDGVDDYIDLNFTPPSDNSRRTISVWIKSSNATINHSPWGYGISSFGQAFELTEVVEPDPLELRVDLFNTYKQFSTNNYLDNSWNHVVVMLYGSTVGEIKLYLNGVEQTESSSLSPSTVVNTSNANNIYVGAASRGPGGWFKGLIDDIRIYNRALSASEIDSLYHESGWPIESIGNLVQNHGFEDGLNHWDPYQYPSGWSSSTENPHSGLSCAKFSFPGGNGYYDASIKQTGDQLYVHAGVPYYFSFWRRETDTHDTHTTNETILDVDLILNGVNYSHPMPNMVPSPNWMQIDTTITFSESGYVYIDFQLHGYAVTSSAVFAIDDIILRQLENPAIILSIDTLGAYVNDTTLVPINVILPSDSQYSSAEIVISQYQEGLDFVEIVTDLSLTGNAGWTYAINETDSLLVTWSAGAQDISGSGVFCWLKFVVTGDICTFVPIILESALFNTGEDIVTTFGGGINIDPVAVFGDVDENTTIQAYDASLVLKHVVGLDSLTCQRLANANVSLDATISALDASLILQFGVGLIDTLPYDTSMGSMFASGDIGMNDDEIQAGQQIDVPLFLSNGVNILSFKGIVNFNPEHLSYVGIVFSELLDAFTIEVNEQNGEIIFAGANSVSNGQSGNFATLHFTVNENFIDDETTVFLSKVRWNEETVMENVASSILTKTMSIDQNNGIPTNFELSQNFPNPFNPVTTISYQLPKSSFVNLYIYNVAGQLVETLVSEHKNAGYHSLIWNAISVGSGVYLYRLEAGKYTETKKCLILK